MVLGCALENNPILFLPFLTKLAVSACYRAQIFQPHAQPCPVLDALRVSIQSDPLVGPQEKTLKKMCGRKNGSTGLPALDLWSNFLRIKRKQIWSWKMLPLPAWKVPRVTHSPRSL